jgi:hypothetical protein
MIVTIAAGDKDFDLDVRYRAAKSRARWGEEWDGGELELPDRAECGTTLAQIIGLRAAECDTYLELAEEEILREVGEACDEIHNDGGY